MYLNPSATLIEKHAKGDLLKCIWQGSESTLSSPGEREGKTKGGGEE